MFRAFSYGSLYPCLRQLLADGLIAEERPADGPPLTGRRSKIVYKLTAEGKERLQELLTQAGPSAWEDESFGVHFAFFRHTEAEVRLRILEGRRSRLEERLESVRTALARTRERLDSYTLELQRHGLESVEREVRWLNELIATERRASQEGPETDTTTTSSDEEGSECDGVGSRGHCRCRQLRGVTGPGRSLLQGRRPGRARAGPDAREVRRLPRGRRRVRRGLRRGRQEGRPRPLGSDRRQREQHHQDHRRAAHGSDRPARPHL